MDFWYMVCYKFLLMTLVWRFEGFEKYNRTITEEFIDQNEML